MSDPKNTQGTPGPDEEADTASGGAPDSTEEILERETTDDDGTPVENPSGG
ncbi:hypothetical protein [Microbacterium saperdae]|jgi:hypothetical protein|uniref:Uncharacterized protein n=1 Tax=Microbacterium saperdae TaxID=69368 RepID=A0A543BK43_9MICO|nr:hypothetical protein [Microbacterium saperdae]TQL85202.1 hypothetical protein FB560_0807 [Microbacterium saperdae]GGM56129.1 hypothetical protein GCM10010489_29680 [Microbacterium saperdae]